MRDLDALLHEIDAVLNQPPLPPLTPWVVSTTPVDRPVEIVRQLLTEDRLLGHSPALTGRWDEAAPAEYASDPNAMWHARHGCDPVPMTVELHGSTPESRALVAEALEDLARTVTEKPRPRPPRPFPVSESTALARRHDHEPVRPVSWWGRWRRRG